MRLSHSVMPFADRICSSDDHIRIVFWLIWLFSILGIAWGMGWNGISIDKFVRRTFVSEWFLSCYAPRQGKNSMRYKMIWDCLWDLESWRYIISVDTNCVLTSHSNQTEQRHTLQTRTNTNTCTPHTTYFSFFHSHSHFSRPFRLQHTLSPL